MPLAGNLDDLGGRVVACAYKLDELGHLGAGQRGKVSGTKFEHDFGA